MKEPTLVIMAAGMGSRFGGLKQITAVDTEGHAIIDFSLFDAYRSGFRKIAFIIKHEIEESFKAAVGLRMEKYFDVKYVYQQLDKLPEGYTVPEGREKPWGTGHAVLCCRGVVDGPFAVINADDFYGRDSFAVIADYLKNIEGKHDDYCMVGYRVGNTLSESGSVSRGVCETDADGFLTTVVERTQIERRDGKVMYKDGDSWVAVDENTPVSMNMWGFTPDYFIHSENYFIRFLRENAGNIKAEYFIPLMVNYLITSGISKVKVLDTTSKWFGVTYAEDRPSVVAQIRALIDAGEYPEKLF